MRLHLHRLDRAVGRDEHGRADHADAAARMLKAYDDYDFSTVSQALNTLVTVDLSAFYTRRPEILQRVLKIYQGRSQRQEPASPHLTSLSISPTSTACLPKSRIPAPFLLLAIGSTHAGATRAAAARPRDQAAALGVSAGVLATLDAVLKGMLLTKLKVLTGCLLAVGALVSLLFVSGLVGVAGAADDELVLFASNLHEEKVSVVAGIDAVDGVVRWRRLGFGGRLRAFAARGRGGFRPCGR